MLISFLVRENSLHKFTFIKCILLCVRLDYRTREELYDGFQGQECAHCGRHNCHPLLHYLLSCLATTTIRFAQPPPAQPEGLCFLTNSEAKAALLVRQTPSDVMLQVLRGAPPPR